MVSILLPFTNLNVKNRSVFTFYPKFTWTDSCYNCGTEDYSVKHLFLIMLSRVRELTAHLFLKRICSHTLQKPMSYWTQLGPSSTRVNPTRSFAHRDGGKRLSGGLCETMPIANALASFLLSYFFFNCLMSSQVLQTTLYVHLFSKPVPPISPRHDR